MVKSQVKVFFEEDVIQILSKITQEFNIPLSRLISGLTIHSLTNFDKGHPYYDFLKKTKLARDLKQSHSVLTGQRHMLYAVDNFCKSIMLSACQSYGLYGEINMEIINHNFTEWQSIYWKEIPKKYKDLMQRSFANLKANYLREEFLLEQVRRKFGDSTEFLRRDMGGKHGIKQLQAITRPTK